MIAQAQQQRGNHGEQAKRGEHEEDEGKEETNGDATRVGLGPSPESSSRFVGQAGQQVGGGRAAALCHDQDFHNRGQCRFLDREFVEGPRQPCAQSASRFHGPERVTQLRGAPPCGGLQREARREACARGHREHVEDERQGSLNGIVTRAKMAPRPPPMQRSANSSAP